MNTRLAKSGKRFTVVAGCLVLSLALAGCTQKAGQGPSEAQNNLQKLLRLRNKFISDHKGQGPKNEDEFKKFVKTIKEADLKDMGLTATDVDGAFISTRDKQPYVINYTVGSAQATNPSDAKGKQKAAEQMSMRKPPVWAYEQKGSGGKRFVALAEGGSVIEVTEEQWNKEYAPSP